MRQQRETFAVRTAQQQREIESQLGVPDWLGGFDVSDPQYAVDPRKPRRLIALAALIGGRDVIPFPHRRIRTTPAVYFDIARQCHRRWRRPGTKLADVVALAPRAKRARLIVLPLPRGTEAA
jgi:hypothetical protein